MTTPKKTSPIRLTVQLSGHFIPIRGSLGGINQPSLCVQAKATILTHDVDLSAVDAEISKILGYEPEECKKPIISGSDREHIYWHLVRWTCALQHEAELPVFSKGKIIAPEHEWVTLVIPCSDNGYRAVMDALNWLANLTNHITAGYPAKAILLQLPAILKALRKDAPKGMNSLRFLEAAHASDIPWMRLSGNTYQFGWGNRARLFDSSFSDATPAIATNLARDKLKTAHLLRKVGLPVPEHALAANAEAATKIADRLGYPVVVKPADKDGGIGVFVGLTNADAVYAAFTAARKLSPSVLVERYVNGNDYRLQVCLGDVYWAVHRVPGAVIGDGFHTIIELLATLNADPLRGPPGSKSLRRIPFDEEAQALLQEQSFEPDSIPNEGQFVRLRRAANVASGGTPIPVLAEAHPDNLQLAERAARVLRLDIAGVDLLIPDIRRSWLEGGAAICEVNAQPQLSSHLPTYLLEKLVKKNGRIPIVMVFGGGRSGADLATKIGESYSIKGTQVGCATTDWATIDGKIICQTKDLLTNTQALLIDPVVEMVLIQIDDMRALRNGMPVDRFDAMVLLEAAHEKTTPQDWHRWRQFVQSMMPFCRGVIFINAACIEWQSLIDKITSHEIRVCIQEELVSALSSHLMSKE